MRALGIDLGSRRVGVALSDGAGTLAVPYEVVVRSGDRARDRARIAELVDEVGAEVVVDGLPRSLDGSAGPAELAARAEVDALRAELPVPVETWDERLTTVTAHRELAAAGVRSRGRRAVVDKVAASVMLQSWLDHRRATEEDA
ncbi:MAG: Holliday junction resolvase RuvX [Acidimicrobiia bacterium]